MPFKAIIHENPDGSFTIDPRSRSNCVYTASEAQKDHYLAYSKIVLAVFVAFGIGMAIAVFFTGFGGQAVVAYVVLLIAFPFLNDALLRRIFRGSIATRRSTDRLDHNFFASDGMRTLFPRWVIWLLFVVSAILFVVTILAPINALSRGTIPEPTLLIFPAIFLVAAIQAFATLRSGADRGSPDQRAR